MDHVLGVDLAQLLTVAAPLPARIAVRIGLDVLSALHAVHGACSPSGHSLRLVHRNVSPQNILIGADGATRLTDFGVARWSSDDAITAVGAVKGATGYVAPELASGGPIDARADVFSLAVVLWEMLTGKRLFKHVIAPEALVEMIERGITPPSELNARAPTRVDDVLLQALSGSAEKRPSGARSFAIDLASALEPASHEDVADFLRAHLRKDLAIQEAQLRELQAVRPSFQLTPPLELVAHSVGRTLIVRGDTIVPSPLAKVMTPQAFVVSPTRVPESAMTPPSWRARALRGTWLRCGWATPAIGLAIASLGLVLYVVAHRGPAFGGAASVPSTEPVPATSFNPPEVSAPTFTAHTAAASASFADETPSSSVLPAPAPRRERRFASPRTKKKAPAAASPCAVPYFIDARGIKRLRPPCY